jgi:predicted O-methyltransferase YrrM
MQGQELRDKIAADAHHDIDMHASWIESVAAGDVFEIGVRTGISTAAFLLGLEAHGGHLYSLDNNPGCIVSIHSHPQWTFIAGDSRDVEDIKRQIPTSLDVLMVDGDHTYKGVFADLANYASLVRSGGRIILHDVASEYDPGVRKAFDEFIEVTGFESEIFPSWVGLGQILVP